MECCRRTNAVSSAGTVAPHGQQPTAGQLGSGWLGSWAGSAGVSVWGWRQQVGCRRCNRHQPEELNPNHSQQPADASFGALCDAYSHPWLGCLLAHPPEDNGSVERALRWAIGSTATETPSLTLMLLPCKRPPPPAYETWLTHPTV